MVQAKGNVKPNAQKNLNAWSFLREKNATDLGKDSSHIPGGTYTFKDHLLSACYVLDVVCLDSSQSPREAPSIFLI